VEEKYLFSENVSGANVKWQ